MYQPRSERASLNSSLPGLTSHTHRFRRRCEGGVPEKLSFKRKVRHSKRKIYRQIEDDNSLQLSGVDFAFSSAVAYTLGGDEEYEGEEEKKN